MQPLCGLGSPPPSLYPRGQSATTPRTRTNNFRRRVRRSALLRPPDSPSSNSTGTTRVPPPHLRLEFGLRRGDTAAEIGLYGRPVGVDWQWPIRGGKLSFCGRHGTYIGWPDFISNTYFTRVAPSSAVTDDATNYGSRKEYPAYSILAHRNMMKQI